MDAKIKCNKLIQINSSPEIKTQRSNRKEKSKVKQKKPKNETKFIKTNLYLNDNNYYFKNAIKMNKLREEKYKENKLKTENLKKNNNLPKMLYFNRFLNNDIKKFFSTKKSNDGGSKINTNSNITNTNISNLTSNRNKDQCASTDNRTYAYKKIEKAILAKNIEENSKSHINKTIKAFDELIKCVDNFEFQKKSPELKIKIEPTNDQKVGNNIEEENYANANDEDEELKVENYNFDEYKEQCKSKKLNEVNNRSQIEINQKEKVDLLLNNFSEEFKNLNDNIYITLPSYISKKTNTENNANDNSKIKQKDLFNSFDNNIIKTNNNKKELRINNMTLISDDSLFNKIKKVGRDFKNGLYFNEYGRFKFTELGLSYPKSVNKYKKIPDYSGKDLEEKKVFKYMSIVSNPKYNYTNIGTFNEKFNHDLSDISTYYGKEYSKGRFIRNPLVSKFSKYIPNYAKYKDLKLIENKYTYKNKYKFRLKPLISNTKNNFDRLANNVYQKEHKRGYFNEN